MLLCCLLCNVEASCHTFRRRLPPSTNSAAYQQLVSSTHHIPSQVSTNKNSRHSALLVECLEFLFAVNYSVVLLGDFNLPHINWDTLVAPQDNVHDMLS